MSKRVGLVVGREWSWPPAFIEEVNQRDQGVIAEYARLGGDHHDGPVPWDVLIDRISHEVPMYRSYLKKAVLEGKTVINNPFMWSADDKFFGAALAAKLGVASPKTVLLPNKDYVPGIVPTESLRNLKFPLDWDELARYVGMPCILKDAHGGGWKEVYVCHSVQELVDNYNHSGLLTMIVQEFIEWDQFVRCLCLGQEEVLPMHYDPKGRKYIVDDDYLTPAMRARIITDCRTLCSALGYDMNSLEFAVKDGVPYAIDFMNCAPDMDLYSLTPTYFDWVVKGMADLAIRLALHPRRTAVEAKWSALFTAAR
ncbi:MAG: glutathione synthase [Gemmatimonadetes bacterium SCN 70-22]|nr:MAG: glutathione synthase [Gemmatimonadetes bacterium SCN 70-22]